MTGVVASLALCLSGCSLLSLPKAAEEPAAAAQPDVAVVTALKHTLYFEEAGCTAVDIGLGRVVTAKHCVEDDDPERNWNIGDKCELGMLVYKSPDRDFAVLVDQARVGNPAPNMRAPRLGEHLYAVGYPLQLATDKQELTVTDGVVAGPLDEENHVRITVPIYFGNSGGGAWAEDGSLLGITVSGFMSHQAMYFMVSAEDVAAALK